RVQARGVRHRVGGEQDLRRRARAELREPAVPGRVSYRTTLTREPFFFRAPRMTCARRTVSASKRPVAATWASLVAGAAVMAAGRAASAGVSLSAGLPNQRRAPGPTP